MEMASIAAVRSRPWKRLIRVYRQLLHRRSSGWQCPSGYDTGIKVYNTVVREKVPLILSLDKVAKWYACGPTVYDVPHVGHACSYVRFDIIRRILERFYKIDVVMAMGITNVDDKIINRAREIGLNVDVVAKQYEDEFLADMNRLRVLPPALYMRVTEHMDSITQFCETLKEKGAAYGTEDGSLYFDVARYARYGVFRSQEDSTAEEGGSKKDPRDFAIWKGAKPGEPKWTTSWGKGRPGWHIECSAMASGLFGSTVDIHTGGKDLIFPHHENEEAQSCSYHGVEQWVNYWLHSGHVQVKKDGKTEKMSKSLGNFVSIREFLQDHSVNVFRMFCLRSPYRNDIELTPKTLDGARATLTKLCDFVADAEAYVEGRLLCEPPSESDVLKGLSEVRREVDQSLADDFNYVRAISSVVKFVSNVNQTLQSRPTTSNLARSPTAVAICMNYVTRLMDDLGVELTSRQTLQTSPYISDSVFASVLDSVVRFRNEVRTIALTTAKPVLPEEQIPPPETAPEGPKPGYPTPQQSPPDDKGGDGSGRTTKQVSKAATKALPRRRKPDPLMEACDALRNRLFTAGVQVKDRGRESSWSLLKDTSLEAKKQALRSYDTFDPDYVPREKGRAK